MFRRLFWLVAGIAIGAWGTTKVNRAARRLTPEGLAETAVDRAAELGGRLRRFTDDVRVGMAEREADLNENHRDEHRKEHRNDGLGREAAYDQGLPGQRSRTAYNRRDDH